MTKLKLYREEESADTDTECRTLPFPAPFPARDVNGVLKRPATHPRASEQLRTRGLVAGKVRKSPLDDGAMESAGRVLKTPELVREIEENISRMQTRLDRFKKQLDEGLKFPRLDGSDLPPAA